MGPTPWADAVSRQTPTTALPGLRMPSGSKAALTAAWRSIETSPSSSRIASSSPASIAATRDLFTSKSVRALVYNTQTEDAVTQDIRTTSEAAGIPVVEVTETLPAGMTFIEWQTKAATDLQAALSTNP